MARVGRKGTRLSARARVFDCEDPSAPPPAAAVGTVAARPPPRRPCPRGPGLLLGAERSGRRHDGVPGVGPERRRLFGGGAVRRGGAGWGVGGLGAGAWRGGWFAVRTWRGGWRTGLRTRTRRGTWR